MAIRPGQQAPIGGGKKPPRGSVTQTATTQLTPEQRSLLGYAMPYAQQYGKTPLHLPIVGGFSNVKRASLAKWQKTAGALSHVAHKTPAQVAAFAKAQKNVNYLQKLKTKSARPLDRVANFTTSQVKGQNMALNAAKNQNQIAAGAQKAQSFLTSGDLMDVGKNPYFGSAASAAARPLTQALTETELPALRDSATMSGNFGSSRQGIAEGLATGRTNQAIGDITSKMALDTYGQGLQAYQNGLNMAPQVQGMQTTGALTTSGVGDVKQGQNQAEIDQNVQNQMFNQQAPFSQASDLLGLTNAVPGATNVTSGPGPQKSLLGGITGGLTLGSALTPLLGPIAPLAGAAIGGVASQF